MSELINRAWLDAIGRKIELGDVLTHATRHGTQLEIHLCVVREFKETSITVDKWGFWKNQFTRSYIRKAANATITGMTEEELLIHLGLGRKTQPLEPDDVMRTLSELDEFTYIPEKYSEMLRTMLADELIYPPTGEQFNLPTLPGQAAEKTPGTVVLPVTYAGQSVTLTPKGVVLWEDGTEQEATFTDDEELIPGGFAYQSEYSEEQNRIAVEFMEHFEKIAEAELSDLVKRTDF